MRSICSACTMFLIIVAGVGLGRCASTPHESTSKIRARRIVWVGAHPDDEVFAAPLLGELCVSGRNRCSLLVLTRGERGVCRLPLDCKDLGKTRSAEEQHAAKALGSGLTQWELVDGSAHAPNDVLHAWSRDVGGCTALLERMRSQLTAADIVLTFDAAHGTSSHPDHRAAAILVASAIAGIRSPPSLFTIQNQATVRRDGSQIRFNKSPIPHAGELRSKLDSWPYALTVARAHPSQFDDEALRYLSQTPRNARRIVASRVQPFDIWQCPSHSF